MRVLGAGAIALLLALLNVGGAHQQTEQPAGVGPKPFIEYFKPLPLDHALDPHVWGAATVGPRDPSNGLEDTSMSKWNYWDGKILRGPDGSFRMFASRWKQSDGHNGWFQSQAVEATSKTLLGPYRDQGLCWPGNEDGKGHNVTALALPQGGYAVVVSETRNGDVFTSRSIDGPWRYDGPISVDQSQFHSLSDAGDTRPLTGPNPRPWHGSNVSLIARSDGKFEIIQRSGQILISAHGVLGPYKVMGHSIYPGLAGLPQDHLERLEDPVLWQSGGWYHVLVNNWGDRRAYHLISRDGISSWRYQGLAYEPGAAFIRYTNGQVNHWNKLERPGVYLQDGHVAAITLAVIDVAKEEEQGNDGHGSKIVVLPFDGAAMDKDLAHLDAQR